MKFMKIIIIIAMQSNYNRTTIIIWHNGIITIISVLFQILARSAINHIHYL